MLCMPVIWERVYFATAAGEIKLHSVQTSDTHTIIENPQKTDPDDGANGFYGLAYDPRERKLYFSCRYAIYRANPDGTGTETVLNSTDCESAMINSWTGGLIIHYSFAQTGSFPVSPTIGYWETCMESVGLELCSPARQGRSTSSRTVRRSSKAKRTCVGFMWIPNMGKLVSLTP